jgi:hypothetical protein
MITMPMMAPFAAKLRKGMMGSSTGVMIVPQIIAKSPAAIIGQEWSSAGLKRMPAG